MIERFVYGPIHELKLARPPVNALNPALLRAIADAVSEAREVGAEALVLSGREGMFSAGLDVPQMIEMGREELRATLETFFDAMEALAGSPVPVAVAITGHSPAGGAVLAVFCDWRVMAAGPYSIGFNEVRIGIPMPDVVIGMIRHVVGSRRAESLCVTGRLLDPQTALVAGLVDEVVPQERVVEAAIAWCDDCLEAPQNALRETREAVRGDLLELVRAHRADDIARLERAWFEPELQAAMRQLVDRLKGE